MIWALLTIAFSINILEANPTPTRTPHEGSVDTYINKEFTGSIPVSDNNQIQLGNTDIKQISGCRFTDLDITNRVFFIKYRRVFFIKYLIMFLNEHHIQQEKQDVYGMHTAATANLLFLTVNSILFQVKMEMPVF